MFLIFNYLWYTDKKKKGEDMKKRLILLMFIIFGLFLVGCKETVDDKPNDDNDIVNNKDDNQDNNDDNQDNNDDVNIPEGLTKEEYDKIVSDFAKTIMGTKENVRITHFYGKYNDKYALIIDALGVYYTEEEISYTIAGVPFTYSNSHQIVIYYNSEFINLNKAYIDDLISPSDVVSIYNKFKNKQVTCSIDKLIINDINGEKLFVLECRFNTLLNTETITKMINEKLSNSNKYKVYLDKDKKELLEEISFSERMEIYVEVEEVILSKWDELLNKYKSSENVNQLLFVKHTSGSNAIVEFYNKVDGKWKLVFSENGVVGTNGIDKQREGDKKTPTGDFGIGSAFGIQANPGTSIPYIDVKATTFACDEESPYYNTIIDTDKVDHVCHGEEMFKYKTAYAYGLQIGYNLENVYPLGSAIFLHVKSGSSTAGCVAITEEHMKTVLKMSDQNLRICIFEK